jgi:uncharacterized protein YacL
MDDTTPDTPPSGSPEPAPRDAPRVDGQPPVEAVSDPVKPLRYDLPSVQAQQEKRSFRLILLVVRLLFLVLLVTVTILTIASERRTEEFGFSTVFGLILSTTSIGIIVLVLDAMTPNKRLSSVVGVYLGVCFGLIGAVAIGSLLDVVADAWELGGTRSALYLGLAKVVVGIVLCYLSVSVVLTTKDDFRLVIPYVEFVKQIRGPRPMILDSSALIDGRVHDLALTGLITAPLVVPTFVVDELQALADSADRLKRGRGRRGLAMIEKLQTAAAVDVMIDDTNLPSIPVDQMLLELARTMPGIVVTTDSGLARIADIQKIPVLNLHDVASAMRPQVVAGETLRVRVLRTGEHPGQAVGYLDDGTMVVVDHAEPFIGEEVDATVSSTLQTNAGRMIFAKVPAPASAVPPASSAHPAAATAPAPSSSTASSTPPAPPDLPPADPAPVASPASPTAEPPEPPPARPGPFPVKPPRSLRDGSPRNPRR